MFGAVDGNRTRRDLIDSQASPPGGLYAMFGTPYEIRTRVPAVKGRYPGPLDERCSVWWGLKESNLTAATLHIMASDLQSPAENSPHISYSTLVNAGNKADYSSALDLPLQFVCSAVCFITTTFLPPLLSPGASHPVVRPHYS